MADESRPVPESPLAVTAAVLWREDRILIARRTRPEWLAGAWEFPGGKIEDGESPQDCLARELREELGLEVEVGALICRTTHRYPQLLVELHAYIARWDSGEPKPVEHDAVEWVLPGELDRYSLAPADLPIAERLLSAGHPPPG